jgi:GTP-binding protein
LAKSSATPGKTQLINFFETRYLYNEQSYPVRFVDLPGFGYAKVSKSLKEVWQKNLVEFIQHRVSIRLFIHLRDARHPHAKIDDDVESYISEFIRPDQRYLTVFTKIDKLNQKERAKLKREFPGSITLSNLKKNGHDRVHQIILQTIFGVGDKAKKEDKEHE